MRVFLRPVPRFAAMTALLGSLASGKALAQDRMNVVARPGEQRAAVPPAAAGKPRVTKPLLLPPNILVNNPTADATSQDTQSESTILRVSGSVLVAAFADSGSDLGVNKFTGYSRSTDGGSTWTDLGVLPTSAAGDGAEAHLGQSATTGTVFLATDSFLGTVNQVFRSTDGGVTFLPPVSAPSGTTAVDFPSLAVDNFAGAGQGTVYVGYRDFGAVSAGMKLTRSTDDGLTWGSAVRLTVNTGQGAKIVVAPDHSVSYFYFLQGAPSTIKVQRSTDGGLTFPSPVTVTSLVSPGNNGDLGLPFRTNSFPRAAVNPASGALYVAYNDPSAASGGDRGNIFFTQSTDSGSTWSAPVKLNTDATTLKQFHPSIAVTPDGTHLAAAWYDGRNDPAGNTLIEYWGVIGTISGGSIAFGSNGQISSPSFAPVFGVDSVVNSVYLTEYDEMTADNTGFDVVWSDGRDDSIFSGATRKNMNVRYARLPLDFTPVGLLGFSAD